MAKFTEFNIASAVITGDYIVGHNAAGNGEIRITAQNLSTSLATMIRPTWNNASTVYKGIDLDVTDSASSSSSRLLNLSVGGSEKFGVSRSGYLRIGANEVLKHTGGILTLGVSGDTKTIMRGNAYADSASIGASYNATAAPSNGAIIQGNLGVGTNNPGGRLDIEAGTGDLLHLNGTGAGHTIARWYDDGVETGSIYSLSGETTLRVRAAGDLYLDGGGVSNGDFVVKSSGNVGIGTTDPTAKLTVNGNVHAGSGVTGNSINYLGEDAGKNNSGNSNTGFGHNTMDAGVSGAQNAGFGALALGALTSGANSVGLGYAAGFGITTSSRSVFIGSLAGRYAGDGATTLTLADQSIIIGYNTQPAGNSQTNQIVIGDSAIGNGSNTATWGNTSITDHFFQGGIHLAVAAAGTNSIFFKEAGNKTFALEYNGTGASPTNLLKIRAANGGDGVIDVDAIVVVQDGGVRLPSLPTSNPGVAGELWNDSGTLKISAG